MMIRKLLKKILSKQQIERLVVVRQLCYNILARLYSNNLTKLAMLYGTDKWGVHFYTSHYTWHFKRLRNKKLKILEIGVGGYDNTKKGGESLRMWKRYFPKSTIYAIDIFDKATLQEKRIKIFKGNQADETFLKDICSKVGPFDIIIDDGSHLVNHIIVSFKILFPSLREGGIYVVEDTQTSYWPSFGGNSGDFNGHSTAMNFFKSLIDGLNYSEFLKPGYAPSYFDRHITAMHFYHNLIFIYKGQNNEGSNVIENGKLKEVQTEVLG